MGRTARTRLLGTPLASTVAAWGRRGLIKSIQRGTVTIASGNTSGTATITAVVTANTRLKYLGSNDAGADSSASFSAYVLLTNTTTVTATVLGAPTAGGITLKFEVVEYFDGVLKSVQRAAIGIGAGSVSNTATITAVDTTKSELTWLGQTVSGGADAREGIYIVLTSATVVTATTNVAAGAETVAFEVAEYY